MSSLFVAFCFIKNINRNDKCISRTALYRINHNVNKFKEVTLVQTVLISSSKGDYVLTLEDLPSSSLLIIYSATVVADSYIPDNQGGRESFMMARQLYNGITNNRNTYVSNNLLPSSTTTNAKGISEVEFNEHLDGIEEKYATLISHVPQKRQNTSQNVNLRNSNNKYSNNKNTSLNFVDIISQVQKGTSSVKTADIGQSLSTTNFASTLQNTSQHISFRATHVEDEEDAALISDDELTELVQIRIQDATPVIKEKHEKNLHSAKK
ncbi:18932_t:CDS:2 [Gigaspora margarita]|uniref:18932_t:CDS:1 n=1 Tax=Gigaspora margarita TaxID=4874 RepID=A0ABN7UJ98_GIGMA|nr:18932_t:CDS:2 [Gigaspora margarita]